METMEERLTSLGTKAAKLRDKGMKWNEVSSDLGVSQGKVLLAWMFVTTPEKERIKFKTEDDLQEKIVKARAAKMSWGLISARSGVPEGKVRRLWEQKTGQSSRGDRIGKGGRFPGESTNGSAKPKAAPVAKRQTAAQKKAAAAVAKAKTKAPAVTKPKATGFDVKTADLDALVDRFEGKTVKVMNSKTEKVESFKVKTVKSATAKEIEIVDAKTGATRTFAREAIKGATK